MTTPEYFTLDDPKSDRLYAQGDPSVPLQYKQLTCSAEERHNREVGAGPIAWAVNHNDRDAWMITAAACGWIIHASLIDEFAKNGITGYRLRPATVRFRDGYLSRDYSELIVVGWAGVAKPESGIRLLTECPGCRRKTYSELENADLAIDWGQWSGEDFFVVWPLPMIYLITKRVADLLDRLKVKHYSLGTLKAREKKPGSARRSAAGGFLVGRLSRTMPEDVAIKYGRPLGLE
jgi:hypothetical protein